MTPPRLRFYDPKKKEMSPVFGLSDAGAMIPILLTDGKQTYMCSEQKGFIPVIIMLATGERDRNGVEVCEHDIVRIDRGTLKPLTFEVMYGRFRYEEDLGGQTNQVGFFFGPHMVCQSLDFKDLEVVGNTYQHRYMLCDHSSNVDARDCEHCDLGSIPQYGS